MTDHLNVIALISGGKDSLFSLLHCIENGHRIVALANLYPAFTSCSSEDRDDQHDQAANHGHYSTYQSAEVESSDMNSFMYQTVGHSIVPLYATVLQLPLYRHQISGSSIQPDRDYDTSLLQNSTAQQGSDEVEDLLPLLHRVISAHPEANAVSTGAILSTYQRTRVESIAIRLGLTPLSYLWQYPVLPSPYLGVDPISPHTTPHRPDSLTGLLEDVAFSDLDARIIKIASAGIPESLLFANVADPHTQSRLVKGLAPFFDESDEMGLRGAVLGEGGEYETIALSGPREVWKGGRIEIDEASNQCYTEGGINYVNCGLARVLPHKETTTNLEANGNVAKAGKNLVRIPSLLDLQFELVKQGLEGVPDFLVEQGVVPDQPNVALELDNKTSTSRTDCSLEGNQVRTQSRLETLLVVIRASNTLTINNLTSVSVDKLLDSRHSPTSFSQTHSSSLTSTAASQLQAIVDHLPSILSYITQALKIPNISMRHTSSTTLLLQSMSDFASVNPIYSKIWPKGLPNPPARVTIAVPLSTDVKVSLSLTVDLRPNEQRRGLHVQGRSYWAPANIGPYSQAIAVPLGTSPHYQDDGSSQDDHNETNHSPSPSNLELVHIAGQIPLVPASMMLRSGPFFDSVILSLQHLWRIGQERGVDIWPWGIALLAQTQQADINRRVGITAAAWREAHLQRTWAHPQDDDDSDEDLSDNSDEIDIWDLQHNRSLYQHQPSGLRKSQMSVGKHLHILPNHTIFPTSAIEPKQKYIPPCLMPQVSSLPRSADIEWWSIGLANFTKPLSLTSSTPSVSWHTKTTYQYSLSCLSITPDPVSPTRQVKFITYMLPLSSTNASTTISEVLRLLDTTPQSSPLPVPRIAQGTAFVTSHASASGLWSTFTNPAELESSPFASDQSMKLGDQVTIVPCHRLWGLAASSVDARTRTMKEKEKDGGTRMNDQQIQGIEGVPELSIAFVLRVEVG